MSKKQKTNQLSNDQVTQLEERVRSLEDQLKRAVADYQNLEKRIQEGRSELTNYVGAGLISKLLPSLQHLETALNGAGVDEQQSGWFKGVQLAVAQLKNALKEEGLEEIPTDGMFDPSLHEAVDMREPTDAEAMAGKGENDMILEVAEKGYTLHNKVIKPARVVVGRKGGT